MVLKKASANRQHDLRSVFQFTFSDDTFIWLGNAPHTILKTHHYAPAISLVTIYAPWNVQVRRRNNKYCLTDMEFISRHGAPPRKPNHSYTISSTGGQQMNKLIRAWQPQSAIRPLSEARLAVDHPCSLPWKSAGRGTSFAHRLEANWLQLYPRPSTPWREICACVPRKSGRSPKK